MPVFNPQSSRRFEEINKHNIKNPGVGAYKIGIEEKNYKGTYKLS